VLDGAVMGMYGADWHFVRTIVYRTGDAPRRHPHRGLKLSRERELLVPGTLMGWHWLGRCRELISDPLISLAAQKPPTVMLSCLRIARRVARVLAAVATATNAIRVAYKDVSLADFSSTGSSGDCSVWWQHRKVAVRSIRRTLDMSARAGRDQGPWSENQGRRPARGQRRTPRKRAVPQPFRRSSSNSCWRADP
jgi:hypothetical protein